MAPADSKGSHPSRNKASRRRMGNRKTVLETRVNLLRKPMRRPRNRMNQGVVHRRRQTANRKMEAIPNLSRRRLERMRHRKAGTMQRLATISGSLGR